MRRIALTGLLFAFAVAASGQSRVFKEVNEDVSSEMKLIMQDNNLVGYLVFSQLEKANADSFNYKISLMDENLNDIGTVNFREENLNLEAVSFEQDILCLVYMKSNVIGREFKNRAELNDFDARNSVFTQFITLDGKIIKTNAEKVSVDLSDFDNYYYNKRKFTYKGSVVQGIQVKNIPGQGHACFYKDKYDNKLVTYDTKGEKKWDKELSAGSSFSMLTTESNVYVLHRATASFSFQRYYITCFNAKSGEEIYDMSLNDGKSNPLNVLSWDIDPVKGTPYLSGNIVNQDMDVIYKNKQFKKNPFVGVFSMDLHGSSKDSIKKKFTYWENGSQEGTISSHGLVQQTRAYIYMTGSFRDYNGNTYFIGTDLIKRFKFMPLLVTSIIVVPLAIASPTSLAYIPSVVLLSGTSRWRTDNTSILKMNAKGALSYEASLPADHSKFAGGGKSPTRILGDRLVYSIDNPETKQNYVISIDQKNIIIYNVSKKKNSRTMPLKSKNIISFVFPAKEGHIMVLERNKKEKYTRLSIEALN